MTVRTLGRRVWEQEQLMMVHTHTHTHTHNKDNAAIMFMTRRTLLLLLYSIYLIKNRSTRKLRSILQFVSCVVGWVGGWVAPLYSFLVLYPWHFAHLLTF